MPTIKNLTPHAITIYPTGVRDSAPVVLPPPPRGTACARVDVAQSHPDALHFDGAGLVVVCDQAWGAVTGLPAPSPDHAYVVSAIVAAAAIASGRSVDDLYVPGDQVRDERGAIVGCRGLCRAASAMPHLGLSHVDAWVSAMRRMGATALRGPVSVSSHLQPGHPMRLRHEGVVPDPGYPFTVWALGPRGVVGSIAVDSGQCPLRPHIVAGEALAARWLGAGGTIDGPGLILRPGEDVVGTLDGREVGGVLDDDGDVRVLVVDERQHVLASRVIPAACWQDLRPASALLGGDLRP